MVKLVSVFVSSAFLIVISYAFISDVVHQFHFTKIGNGSDKYNFEYELSNGTIFRGTTLFLYAPTERLYVMFGADKSIYWFKLLPNEYENYTSFTKNVRLAQKTNDSLYLKDDFSEYRLTISDSSIYVGQYGTEWDLDNICFKKDAVEQIFYYTITAINNSRKYKNTTVSESNNSHVQRLYLDDWPQCRAVYEINFTDYELQSSRTFCKGISKEITKEGISAAFVDRIVNPNLIHALSKA